MESQPSPTRICAHDLQNDDGDAFTRYQVWKVPSTWSHGDIVQWAKDLFPARRCQHQHDCCGHYYPRTPTVAVMADNAADDTVDVLIRQVYAANI